MMKVSHMTLCLFDLAATLVVLCLVVPPMLNAPNTHKNLAGLVVAAIAVTINVLVVYSAYTHGKRN
jgi:hypothetical protein